MPPLLQIKELVTVFDTNRGRIKAVNGVSLILQTGETLGIVGESGCGKTMLALSIMRLIPANGSIIEGTISFQGDDLLKLLPEEMRAKRGNEIAMVFQEPMTSLNPVLRIGEQIAEALRLHSNLSAKEAMALSIEQLREVGIPDPERRARDYPHQLSGGMRQRVMIAMAMSCHPRLLLADEPTTALDVTIQAQILDLIADLKKKNNMAVILITHDLGIISQTAENVAVMYAGKIVENSPTIDIFANPLHPYTRGLIDSLPAGCGPSGRQLPEHLQTIPGSVPSLYNLAKGCSFRDRCSRAFSPCADQEPKLMEIKSGHFVACFWAQQTKH
ncbi:MAG: peptide ABC transporter ATP-binding protein [Deltaproteobacteria bacterium HGW-Deltaproteobacteria-12]|jgi:oligopeptide/dipeptide ABC transporter ATP-binding protein|nr:MAG: peptide ABC transporter ATP-binding protein [Deltaproteobacteria bacterium HGW-Deltaproteobacteria-12]